MLVKRFEDAKSYEAPNHRGVVALRLQGFEPGAQPINGSGFHNIFREAAPVPIQPLSKKSTSSSRGD